MPRDHRHLEILLDQDTPLLECPTRHLDRERGRRRGLDACTLAHRNRRAVAQTAAVRRAGQATGLLAGVIAPCPRETDEPAIGAAEARYHHLFQLAALATTEVDVVVAEGIAGLDEALGIQQAAQDVRLPVILGLSLDARGRLAGGEAALEALGRLENAGRSRPVAYILELPADAPLIALPPRAVWIDRVRVRRAEPVTAGLAAAA